MNLHGSCHFVLAPEGDRMICVHAPACQEWRQVRPGRNKVRRRRRREKLERERR